MPPSAFYYNGYSEDRRSEESIQSKAKPLRLLWLNPSLPIHPSKWEKDFEDCCKTTKMNGEGRGKVNKTCILCFVSTHTSSFKRIASFTSAKLAVCHFPYYKHFLCSGVSHFFSSFLFFHHSLFILPLQVLHPHPPWHKNKYSFFVLLFPPLFSNTSLTDPQPLHLRFFWCF